MPRGRRECGLRRATDVTAKLASAGQSGGQEDLGLPLQLNCSQEAKVIADHFARITSMLRDSTVLSVVNAVCNSEPVLGEFWSHE